MDLSPVTLAIPMFFTLMAVELVFESVARRRTYRLNDAVTNISTGVLQQLTGTFFAIVNIGIYTIVWEKFRLFDFEATWLTFIAVFIGKDFFYYWYHRLSHEISLFWGGHSVHHQSEDYNLSVALRQSSTDFLWSFSFYLPLALAGFDPTQYVLVSGLNLLYQFWIHTEHIDKLPRWFEAVFNTPSHHRVHHARNPKYIDKNYAGVFIVWDKFFGTFVEEKERPTYGITKPLNSWNPVYANFAHYIDLYHCLKKTRSPGDALRVLFSPPGWLPDYLGGPVKPKEVEPGYRKYDVHPNTLWMNLYILTQFLVALLLNAVYFFSVGNFEPATKVGYAAWMIVTTLMFGFLFESPSRWLGALEVLRLLCIPLGLYLMGNAGVAVPAWALPLAITFTLASLASFGWIVVSNRKVPEFQRSGFQRGPGRGTR